MNRDPFAAIADPTRRQIINLLADNPLTINEIAENFSEVSRQAVSKQIKYLEESGLLSMKKAGREKYCYVQLDNLSEVYDWLRKYESYWLKKLENLESYLNKDSKQ